MKLAADKYCDSAIASPSPMSGINMMPEFNRLASSMRLKLLNAKVEEQLTVSALPLELRRCVVDKFRNDYLMTRSKVYKMAPKITLDEAYLGGRESFKRKYRRLTEFGQG